MATILCIDDEASSGKVRKLLLESEGYRVIASESGQEGLLALQAERVDLVILDYWMSGMNGIEVAERIKVTNPSIPIIMLSGFAELPGEAIGLADRWILKGRSTHELLAAIGELLRNRKGESHPAS
jgi:CheY-like chemotaxis protein